MSCWSRLWRHGRFEAELDRELRDHVDRSVAEHTRNGMTEAEARRQARLEVGSLDHIREQCRDVRGTRWAIDAMSDVRFALRTLAARWPFTLVVLLVLGLGLGVTTMFFTMYYTLTMRGLPIEEPDRVLWVASRDARARELGVSYSDFEVVRRAATRFRALAALATGPAELSDDELAPDRFLQTYVSSEAFRLLGEGPALGRDFRQEDDRVGAAPVVILGEAIWANRYGRDPDIIGRTVRVDGTPTEVVGVMSVGFRFPATTDLWQPLTQMPRLRDQPRDVRRLGVFGRLEDGVAVSEAQAELGAIATALAHDYPETNAGVQALASPINDRYTQDPTQAVWVAFMSAGVVVLLVACANVANLLLMRAVQRSHEMALRVSLGASRSRIVRHVLTENALLALAGGVVGLGLAALGLRSVTGFIPDNMLGYAHQLTFDGRVFAVLAAACLGTVFVFGFVPALFVSQTEATHRLKDGGRMGTRRRAAAWTTLFLAAEFGLTLILLTALGGGVRANLTAQNPFTEVDPRELLTAQLALPAERYGTPDQRVAFYDALRRALGEVPVVTSATLTSALPTIRVARRQIQIEGRESEPDELAPDVGMLTVDRSYFDTLDVPLVRGRWFDAIDGAGGFENAIVNERFVEVMLPGEDPVGRRFRLLSETRTGEATTWFTIVGVAPVIRQQPSRLAVGRATDPLVYLPLRATTPAAVSLIVRGSGDPVAVTSAVRDAARRIDADLPLFRPLTLAQAIEESEWNERLSNGLIWTITLLALLLSAVGLYGVTAHAVAQRMREFGVRLALGAEARHVRTMILRSVARRLVLGALAGIVCVVAWGRWIGGDAQSSWMLVPSMAVLSAIAFAAVLPVLRRATTLDPVRVLRWE